MAKKEEGYNLTKEEVVAILDFFQHTYIHYDNILLIDLLRRMEKYWKKLERQDPAIPTEETAGA